MSWSCKSKDCLAFKNLYLLSQNHKNPRPISNYAIFKQIIIPIILSLLQIKISDFSSYQITLQNRKPGSKIPIFARWKNQIRLSNLHIKLWVLNLNNSSKFCPNKFNTKIVQMNEPRRPSTQEARPWTLTIISKLMLPQLSYQWRIIRSFKGSCRKKEKFSRPAHNPTNHKPKVSSKHKNTKLVLRKTKEKRPCLTTNPKIPYNEPQAQQKTKIKINKNK